MRKTKNTIKINGHTYDATTGELLHAAMTAHTTAAPQPQVAGTVIKPETTPKPSIKHKSSPFEEKATTRHKAQSANRTPQHSKTLMRHSVKKPEHAANSHSKTPIKSTGKLSKTSSVIAVKQSARRVDEHRLKQAKLTPKSQKIAKFTKSAPTPHTPAHRPKPQSIQHHVTTTHHRRSVKQPTHRQKTTADLLQDALHHASSHKQPHHKKRLTRSQQVFGMSALIVTSGVLLAIVVMQSAPSIKMRVASAKAGFAASLPGYNPSGFHLGDLSYGAGAVAMDYKSNSDSDRKFSITQKTSSWDSTTLRDTFVEKTDRNFTVAEDGGLTVFLYGNNNATWVSDGVWYQVQGNGSLSDRQLVDIAKSL